MIVFCSPLYGLIWLTYFTSERISKCLWNAYLWFRTIHKKWYCWWKKSGNSWYDKYLPYLLLRKPIFYFPPWYITNKPGFGEYLLLFLSILCKSKLFTGICMSQLLQDFFWPSLSKLLLSKMTKDHMKSASSQSVASMLTNLWHQCSQEFSQCNWKSLKVDMWGYVHFTEGLVLGCFWVLMVGYEQIPTNSTGDGQHQHWINHVNLQPKDESLCCCSCCNWNFNRFNHVFRLEYIYICIHIIYIHIYTQ